MRVAFLDLHQQYKSIKKEVDAAISKVIEQSAFVRGPFVTKFEEEFAEFIGAKFCLGVANGTDALEIAIQALELPANSQVIVPALTFIATAEAVTKNGHQVIFADVNPSTYNLDISKLEKLITPKTKAIVAVHLYGQPVDMKKLMMITKKHNLKLIEDCAQAHGAKFNGKNVGSFGDIATFSFYPGKNLGAYGDAGAIVTNSAMLAKKCKIIANHGGLQKYQHLIIGCNSRLDGIQAAILSVKLKKLDTWNTHRNEVAKQYLSLLKNVPEIKLPVTIDQVEHVFHQFTIQAKNRDELMSYLERNGIESNIHYPQTLPMTPAYHHLLQKNHYLSANKLPQHLLSLPMGDHLTADEVSYVCNKIKLFYVKN